MRSIEGKIVLITGAAIGMGRLYARHAVAERADAVVLWDLDADALEATRAELSADGAKVIAHVVDVSSPEAVDAAAARVRAEAGDPDIVINNAGDDRLRARRPDPQRGLRIRPAVGAEDERLHRIEMGGDRLE